MLNINSCPEEHLTTNGFGQVQTIWHGEGTVSPTLFVLVECILKKNTTAAMINWLLTCTVRTDLTSRCCLLSTSEQTASLGPPNQTSTPLKKKKKVTRKYPLIDVVIPGDPNINIKVTISKIMQKKLTSRYSLPERGILEESLPLRSLKLCYLEHYQYLNGWLFWNTECCKTRSPDGVMVKCPGIVNLRARFKFQLCSLYQSTRKYPREEFESTSSLTAMG